LGMMLRASIAGGVPISKIFSISKKIIPMQQL